MPALGAADSNTPVINRDKRRIVGTTPTKNILTFDASENNPKSNRDVSPIRAPNIDDIWSKYEQQVKDENGLAELKKDTVFLDKLL